MSSAIHAAERVKATMPALGLREMIFLSMLSALPVGGARGDDPRGGVLPAPEAAVQRLAEEVRDKGRIVFCAPTRGGDWDLFVCRPDGSDVRNLTRTPDWSEAAPQFSRDGTRLLYRRLSRGETIDGNHYGAQGQLVIARSDATEPAVLGESGEYSWASWSPDGRQVACLSLKGIFFVEIETRKTLRTLPRKGFFQQLVWSPDGRWLGGVANSFGTGWSIARMDPATGEASAVSRVDCCTPDWFPDSLHLVFSSRPPGQKTNEGYGWTQLWMADLEGKRRMLLFGEEGRHIYGGHVSPGGEYVVFAGNMQENGDPGSAGAPMGLIRIADAPIIAGESRELRALHPEAKSGPVLQLPVGWEPCWMPPAGEGDEDAKKPRTEPRPPDETPGSARRDGIPDDGAAVESLSVELREKGWIVFSSGEGGEEWDLFRMRPDGSDRWQLTDTDEYSEAGARFSPDGTRLLHFRIPAGEPVDNNTYGTHELVISAADGSDAAVFGRDCAWASWGPDSRSLACLDRRGIRIVDVESRRISRELPRRGIVQQLVWSPDGKWLAGTANGLGVAWTIARLDVESGMLGAASETDRYNCTPDWLPDSRRIIYSRGIIPGAQGHAELWVASGDGGERRLLYAEESRHIYGGCVSPDGEYVLFTRSEADLGCVEDSRTRMAIIRWRDAPMASGGSAVFRENHAGARSGPRLDLGPGWEPHWTYAPVHRERP
ncbi:MAG: PD40 domain-containing protein [Planctomycetes bacterium]|nr:PD40 domain-containing protein [Planctomycetota bacterium]